MKRIRLLSSIAALCIALGAAPAMAQEGTMPDWANKNGAFGLGANTTLGGVNGINLRTYIGPLFGLHLTLGFSWGNTTATQDNIETSTSSFRFQTGIYGSYKLAYWQRGHLSLLFGVDIVSLSNSVDVAGTTTDESGVDILLGLGFFGEWFPTQYLSLFAAAGFRIDFIGSDEVDGDSIINNEEGVDYSGAQIDMYGQLFGQAGFTVWFR